MRWRLGVWERRRAAFGDDTGRPGVRVTFHPYRDVGRPGDDGQSIEIRFECARLEALPGESATEHRLRLQLSDTKAKGWGLSPEQARAYMAHVGRLHVEEILRERPANEIETPLNVLGPRPKDPANVPPIPMEPIEISFNQGSAR